MNALPIFLVVWAAMIANSFWEAYVEGRNTCELGKLGWKIKLGKYYFTGYHFYLFYVMYPLLLSLPLVIYGWNLRLFGILLSAYATGMAIEDIMWFVVNPVVKFSEWGTDFTSHYPWVGIGKFRVPTLYVVGLLIAILSWYFLWRKG
jgi:ABC-type uncharacterized transport system permease subunit